MHLKRFNNYYYIMYIYSIPIRAGRLIFMSCFINLEKHIDFIYATTVHIDSIIFLTFSIMQKFSMQMYFKKGGNDAVNVNKIDDCITTCKA